MLCCLRIDVHRNSLLSLEKVFFVLRYLLAFCFALINWNCHPPPMDKGGEFNIDHCQLLSKTHPLGLNVFVKMVQTHWKRLNKPTFYSRYPGGVLYLLKSPPLESSTCSLGAQSLTMSERRIRVSVDWFIKYFCRRNSYSKRNRKVRDIAWNKSKKEKMKQIRQLGFVVRLFGHFSVYFCHFTSYFPFEFRK